ncbi:holo-[acyl-carrier-protein] synthase [Lichtheimia ornata]|uniref:Holo-[acyl-carrier-protein] synthase n=1 Tax=Lichtheimia ornata TaxID=688661 RepID=A0AAD7XZ43_9FUNG|nr:holo-[acyl-carrier-protein] synthase [Lichtheimia ornata]KAJ8658208.1 holo-[acyl-carrier-protein] synthase [Lichtheimia ornata]
MTILGIGVDIVHLPRIAALIARRGREPLAKRILSPDEYTEFLQRCSSDRNIEQQVMYLGSRWCIKEATYKALFPVHKLEWKQVTVAKDQGKPMLRILNSEAYGIRKAHVSLSHDTDYAVAQVILES